MTKKDIAVIGLGTFGYELAVQLARLGHQVMAVDVDMKKVNEIKEHVEAAIQADITDPDVLRKLKIEDFDEVILAMSSAMESIILAIVHMKKQGVKHIIGKANNYIQREILLKIGADEVIMPEVESAIRLAEKLTYPGIKEKLVMDDHLVLMEMEIPPALVGKSLRETDLRNKYGINVIMYTRDGKVKPITDPSLVFRPGDILLVAGDEQAIKKHLA